MRDEALLTPFQGAGATPLYEDRGALARRLDADRRKRREVILAGVAQAT